MDGEESPDLVGLGERQLRAARADPEGGHSGRVGFDAEQVREEPRVCALGARFAPLLQRHDRIVQELRHDAARELLDRCALVRA